MNVGLKKRLIRLQAFFLPIERMASYPSPGQAFSIVANYFDMATILTKSQIGNPSLLFDSRTGLKTDITNFSSCKAFDIKPSSRKTKSDSMPESTISVCVYRHEEVFLST